MINQRRLPFDILFLSFVACLFIGSSAHGEGLSQSSLKVGDLDPGAYMEWVGGVSGPPASSSPKGGPTDALWTRTSQPEIRGVSFGQTAAPGVRHLRIGFNAQIAIGSVLVRGGGKLSVLKSGAAYPGNLANDADWQPATRIAGDSVSSDEVGRDEFAVWVLPPATTTRALRFTHTSKASDPKYEGWLGGALIIPDRVVNVAPQALADAGSRDEAVFKINNEKDEQWQA